MKKTYIIPQVEIHAITVETLIATSPDKPSAAIDPTKSAAAEDLDVKGNTQSYDVWDDDWSR